METDTNLAAGATDRRTALKKAAAAAGVVAWTTPAVQVLSSGTAHAQTVTGCVPLLTVSLAETGPDCDCTPNLLNKCCSDNTSFPTVTADCGSTCGGAGTIVGEIILAPAPNFKCNVGNQVSVELDCDTIPDDLTVQAEVKCADGSITTVAVMGPQIGCTPCIVALAAPAIVPAPDVSTVDPAVTTSTEPAPTPTDAATTTTTEPPPPTESAAPPADDTTP